MMNKPILTSTGAWLFPIAVWNHGIRALSPEYDSSIPEKGSFAYTSYDEGKTFHKLGYADIKDRSFDEHMILEMQDKSLMMYVRTNYGIGAARSLDGGLTWIEGFNTGYGGPNSRFHIRRLKSGRILLINHYNYTGRNNLTAMLSEDDGQTFPYTLLLDERASVSYPDAKEAEDGFIYITYDRERGAGAKTPEERENAAKEILIAKIREEDILNGKLIDPDSFLQRVANKLERISS